MTSSRESTPSALAGAALREAIRKAVSPLLDLDRFQLFLFGSEASGLADRRSDIDVGILGPRPVSGAIRQRILERLETLPTLRTFDVVDLGSVDEAFKAEALKHAERL
jgi:predicted nucleotidyltransferase